MAFEEQTAALSTRDVACNACGAQLHFAPGTRLLKCTYCSSENEIAAADAEPPKILSHAYDDFVAAHHKPALREALVAQCSGCGATTSLPAGTTADACSFCASPLAVSGTSTSAILQPHYVLPFDIKAEDARARFRAWLKSLWFAPNDLMKCVQAEGTGGLKGVYLPYWSYDCDATTPYTGARGDHYYTSETYTEGGQTKTRQVRHTRWTAVSGTIEKPFADVLVCASPSLPQDWATTLEPWKLESLAHFDERYLSGFRSETYRTDAQSALTVAKEKMADAIRTAIRAEIGGDEQRIDSFQPAYANMSLKYLLLPVWTSAYKYRQKVYRFMVNASTGEVHGDRPWSWMKIALAVLLALALAALWFWLNQS